ncbi:MAG: CRISPR-associated protein [Deltaproteobacteria bacterium RIFOXYD12_FULL_50_9]|nr:MAG: CRISPR-associated protein [Deltaproteobacteria bacterium RIFOXYD12_FULL_50_9]
MKNVLLAMSGLNPQVITEALYAILHEGRQVDAIQIITTRIGKERLLTGLLSPINSRYSNFLAEFGLTPENIDFGPQNIHVLTNEHGSELDDIITPADNEILIRTCLELAWTHTRTPQTAVFFLVAGGRKTMTSCLTLAAQLYGRPQDRIYHVLVSPEFENCPDFWYPPRNPVRLALLDKNGEIFYKETSYAIIHLVSIPFVSVRDRIPDSLLEGPHPPTDLMAFLIKEELPGLRINLATRKVSFGTTNVDFHPARLALYAFLVGLKKRCELTRACRNCSECFVETSDILASSAEIAQLYKTLPVTRRSEAANASGILSLTKENFRSYRSKIRDDLRRAFGQTALFELEIAAEGRRPDTRYGIRLDRKLIVMEN